MEPDRSHNSSLEQETKKALRQRMLAARASVDPEERRRWDARIRDALLASEEWERAGFVMAYCSMPEEVATADILRAALAAGKRLALPRCEKSGGRFEAVEMRDLESDLEPGSFRGLREPLAHLAPLDETPDLLVVPGVAFDRRGNRVGFGAGMYDRFLERHGGAFRLALAYSIQVVDRAPAAPHDMPMHAVLTERGFVDLGVHTFVHERPKGESR